MKTLDFLIGLPASGKSTYAKIKEKENGAIVLSSDRIRKELNITRERVRQIQIKAIKKLAGLNLSKELKSFLWD